MKKYVLISMISVLIIGALGVAINAHQNERMRFQYSKCDASSMKDAICRYKSRQDFSKIRRVMQCLKVAFLSHFLRSQLCFISWILRQRLSMTNLGFCLNFCDKVCLNSQKCLNFKALCFEFLIKTKFFSQHFKFYSL